MSTDPAGRLRHFSISFKATCWLPMQLQLLKVLAQACFCAGTYTVAQASDAQARFRRGVSVMFFQASAAKSHMVAERRNDVYGPRRPSTSFLSLPRESYLDEGYLLLLLLQYYQQYQEVMLSSLNIILPSVL